MSARGRPFRFLGLVCIAWVGARVALLWPEADTLPEAIDALVPLASKPVSHARPETIDTVRHPPPAALRQIRARPAPVRANMGIRPAPFASKAEALLPMEGAPVTPPFEPQSRVSIAPARLTSLPDRWSASGWFVARSGRGTGAAPGGQLGGGQAGARLAYLLVPRRRIAAFARATAPLAGRGSEVAVGIEWQPWRAPIRFAIEQRVGVDGERGGPGAGIVTGLYHETHGFRIEGYGQAGAIARRRIEPYADGAIRVIRAIAPRLSFGAGAWGGAQRDAQRLDIGPSAGIALGRLRLSLDWRQRIAGRAAPGSGMALTLGGDF